MLTTVQALGHLLTEILGNVRLEVPPWQRRYSWGTENWSAMWQSVTEVAGERKAKGWDETVDELHEAHVNLLGNLTLAKQSRNVQYGNKHYPEKIALINQFLPIQLNRQLGTGAYKMWGIEAIRKR